MSSPRKLMLREASYNTTSTISISLYLFIRLPPRPPSMLNTGRWCYILRSESRGELGSVPMVYTVQQYPFCFRPLSPTIYLPLPPSPVALILPPTIYAPLPQPCLHPRHCPPFLPPIGLQM